MSEGEWRDDAHLLERIESLLDPARAEALAAAARRAAGVPLPTLEAMAARRSNATGVRRRHVWCRILRSTACGRRGLRLSALGPPKAGDDTLAHARAPGGEPVLASSATGLGDVAKRCAHRRGTCALSLLPEGVRAALKSRMR